MQCYRCIYPTTLIQHDPSCHPVKAETGYYTPKLAEYVYSVTAVGRDAMNLCQEGYGEVYASTMEDAIVEIIAVLGIPSDDEGLTLSLSIKRNELTAEYHDNGYFVRDGNRITYVVNVLEETELC